MNVILDNCRLEFCNKDVAHYLAISLVMNTSCFPFFVVTNNTGKKIPIRALNAHGQCFPRVGASKRNFLAKGWAHFTLQQLFWSAFQSGWTWSHGHPSGCPCQCLIPFVTVCASLSPWYFGPWHLQPPKPDGFLRCPLTTLGRRRTRGAC